MVEDVRANSNLFYFFRRSLKILAESYAIKGLCLENQEQKGTSKFKLAERESEMVCFLIH